MFERLTAAARSVLTLAQDEAGRERHAHIGTEHLLLGLLAEEQTVAAAALRQAGLTLEAARVDVVRRLGPAPLGAGDAAALRAVGFNLDDVRAAVEAAFGPGALAAAPHCRQPRRHRDDQRPPRNCIPFTPRAKKALELALRESLRYRHRSIGAEHILLGLLREGDGLVVQILGDHAISPELLRANLLSAMGQVA